MLLKIFNSEQIDVDCTDYFKVATYLEKQFMKNRSFRSFRLMASRN